MFISPEKTTICGSCLIYDEGGQMHAINKISFL